MKKLLIAFCLFVFAAPSFAVVMGWYDKGTNITFSDKRAVVVQGKKTYVCPFVSYTKEDIDDGGYAYEANTHSCGNRVWFVAKHFHGTDVWQLRLYDAKTGKYLYDNVMQFKDFKAITSS